MAPRAASDELAMVMAGSLRRLLASTGSTRLVGAGWILLPLLTAVALSTFELSRPDALFGVVAVDDGVYFSAAYRLVDGVLPYRDFVLLHPSGIAVLLAPLAALSHLIGSRDGLACARILTAVVAVANVGMVGVLLRRYGRAVGGLGAGLAALFPLAVAAVNTLTLEPYFVLFALLGIACVLGPTQPSRRAAIGAGVLFAVAVDIKAWAIVPVGFGVVCASWRHRKVGLGLLAGFSAAIVVLVGPFVAVAPGAYVRDVVATQFDRATSGGGGESLSMRVFDLTGVAGFAGHGGTTGLAWAVVAAAALLVVAAGIVGRRGIGPFECAIVASWITLTVAVASTRDFFPYYSYAPAILGALGLGVATGVITGAHRSRHDRQGPGTSRIVRFPAVALVLVVFGVIFARDLVFAEDFYRASNPFDPSAEIAAHIPPGACVLSDQISLVVDGNRLGSNTPECPAVIDPYGTWLVADPNHPPPSPGPYNASLVATWDGWLSRAEYLVLEFPISPSRPIPAAPSVLEEFTTRFRLTYGTFGANVYERIGS